MRTAVTASLILGIALSTVPLASAQEIPDLRMDYWQYASDPELVAYSRVETHHVYAANLIPMGPAYYFLEGSPWTQIWNPWRKLCPWTHFYGQHATAFEAGVSFARGYSAVLVGPDLILTARHTLHNVGEPADCLDRAFVFDYTITDESHAGDPPLIPAGKVYYCVGIVAESTTADLSLVQLDRPVTDRLPIKIRREGQPQVGTPVVNVGHPDRLPMKLETGFVTGTTTTWVQSEMHVRTGSSGSPLINRVNGLLEGIAHGPGWGFAEDPEGCWTDDLSWVPNVFFGGVAALAGSIPELGLVVSPASDEPVEQFGQLGGPFSNASVQFEIRNAEEARPVAFSVQMSGEYWTLSGPTSGVLKPGSSVAVTVDLSKSAYLLTEPTLATGVLEIDDNLYGTRETREFILHAGRDGFTVSPNDKFIGEGPGAFPTDTKQYTLTNSFPSPLLVQVNARTPWITIDGVPSSTTVEVPAEGARSVTLGFDAELFAALPNGVYQRAVRFEPVPSNGEYEERIVRLDNGRLIYELSGLSIPVDHVVEVELPVDDSFEILNADAGLLFGPSVGERRLTVEVIGPSGHSSQLLGAAEAGAEGDASSWLLFDDDYPETPPPPQPPVTPLSVFQGDKAIGTWIFRFTPPSQVSKGTEPPPQVPVVVQGVQIRLTPTN